MSSNTVITRFAPSPTGFLHIGGVRTALFSYLFARQNEGKFALRIEDTDTARNKEEWTKAIIDDLAWLGLSYDAFVKQSDKADVHAKYIKKLIDSGAAYISKETPREPGQRDEVIRFKNPNKVIAINDLIRGEVKVDTTDLNDFVIARSMTEPIFHLAVVVDDFEMGITHVIRAEEHLSNTPRQILIQEAVGAPRPQYAHLPLVLAADKSKLSKRKHGEAVSLTYYRNKGYLPEALINFVALLGWNPGTDQELFSLEELIEKFSLDKVQKSGAVFNIEKLNWFNRQYLEKLTDEEFMEQSKKFVPEWLASDSASGEGGRPSMLVLNSQADLIKRLLPLIREKISVFGDIAEMFGTTGELSFVQELPNYPADLLLWKKNPSREEAQEHLLKSKELLSGITDSEFTAAKIKEVLWPYAEAEGKGDVLWPLRVALTGQEKSPDPFTSAFILGREEAIARIGKAVESLEAWS